MREMRVDAAGAGDDTARFFLGAARRLAFEILRGAPPLLLAAACVCALAPGARAQRKGRSAEPAAPAPRNLKYRVEIGGDTSPETAVVTAVGYATAFHCPEPVLGVVFGNKEGITVEEGGPLDAAQPGKPDASAGQPDRAPSSIFYIRPTKADVRTNMFIEMASGTVAATVMSVSQEAGTQAGSFNKEVYVRKFGYRDELAKLKAENAGLAADLGAASAKLASATRDADSRVAAAQAGADRAVIDEALPLVAAADGEAANEWANSERGRRERSRLVKEMKGRKQGADAQPVLFQMYGTPRRASSGRLYATFVVENLGAGQVELTKVTGEASGERAEVASAGGVPAGALAPPSVLLAPKSPKVIAPGARAVITVAVEGVRQGEKNVALLFHFLPPVGVVRQALPR